MRSFSVFTTLPSPLSPSHPPALPSLSLPPFLSSSRSLPPSLTPFLYSSFCPPPLPPPPSLSHLPLADFKPLSLTDTDEGLFCKQIPSLSASHPFSLPPDFPLPPSLFPLFLFLFSIPSSQLQHPYLRDTQEGLSPALCKPRALTVQCDTPFEDGGKLHSAGQRSTSLPAMQPLLNTQSHTPQRTGRETNVTQELPQERSTKYKLH